MRQLPTPFRTVLIVGGLFVAIVAIYKNCQTFNHNNLLIGFIGFSTFLIGFDPLSSKKPYLLITDSKIEYKIINISSPWKVLLEDIESAKFNNKKFRYEFKLTNNQHKNFYIRFFPYELRPDIINTLNLLLSDHGKKITNQP